MRKLIPIQQLSKETEIPVRTLRTLTSARKIPHLKLGWRTILYSREAVEKALSRFEISEVGAAK